MKDQIDDKNSFLVTINRQLTTSLVIYHTESLHETHEKEFHYDKSYFKKKQIDWVSHEDVNRIAEPILDIEAL